MDRRQQKTRKAVYKAFSELLCSKSYSAITVQDIIDEADIGRSTFYAHFETKDDLLKELCNEIFDHVFSEHLTQESSHDFSGADRDLSHELTHILYHLQDNREYISAIISSDGCEIFMRYFKQHLGEVFEKEIHSNPENVPHDYYLNYLVSGFAETVRWWMSHEASPEEVFAFYSRMYLSQRCQLEKDAELSFSFLVMIAPTMTVNNSGNDSAVESVQRK
jgi:AcrR family transcriptional regulator